MDSRKYTFTTVLDELRRQDTGAPYQINLNSSLPGRKQEWRWAIRNPDGTSTLLTHEGEEPPRTYKADERFKDLLTNDLKLNENDLVNAHSSQPHGRTALIQAVICNNLSLVNALLDCGADPSLCDTEENNALVHAAADPQRSAILLELMKLISAEAVQKVPEKDKKSGKEAESTTTIKPAKTAPVASTRIETTPASSIQEEKKAVPTAKTTPGGKSAARIQLNLSVLTKKNKLGQDAAQLIKQNHERCEKAKAESKKSDRNSTSKKPSKAKADSVSQEAKEVKAVPPQNELQQLKQQVQDIHEQQARSSTPIKSLPTEATSQEEYDRKMKAEADTKARARQEKLAREKEYGAHAYDKFYTKKYQLFHPAKAPQPLLAARARALQEARERQAARAKHGLILMLTDKPEALEDLHELSKMHHYDPILVKEFTADNIKDPKNPVKATPDEVNDPRNNWYLRKTLKYSVYGHTTEGWALTELNKAQVRQLQESMEVTNENAWLGIAFDVLAASDKDHHQHITHEKLSGMGNALLHGTIFLGHDQILSSKFHDTQPQAKEEKQAADVVSAEEKPAQPVDVASTEEKAAQPVDVVSIVEKPSTAARLAAINSQPSSEDQRLQSQQLPVLATDKAKLQAALCLLKDYIAPESAPVPHCLPWGALRRLLTFNLGRRYCSDAETLLQAINTFSPDRAHSKKVGRFYP